MNKILYILAVLMLTTSGVYFVATYQVVGELMGATGTEVMGLQLETIFFAAVAVAYIPLTIWIIKTKHNQMVPYLITIIGSVSLIILYVVSRTIGLPLVGVQEDIGSVDMISKILQGAVIACAIYLLYSMSQFKKKEEMTVV
jgi:hypothetical protein